ncbi:hypothetical protein ACFFS2_23670 [Streptomyces aurantiacus]|uniref:Uncharacterized protein n=1 Tax=Streptomyces aurantiacus TaxID=47760 RepID=A0A7G1NSX0_9ACTN|nr:hypothetical protein [Streptomyces aurantiacus]BCL26363.1 hypothetical protein GCM10017557_12220 [Streptomyces aurantiacus]
MPHMTVWDSAATAVSTTRVLGSRHEAYEVLAALRVLRAHLNFAESAGGPLRATTRYRSP